MKVALCFIISYKHILNKEQLWIDWIQPNQDILNVYFHYTDLSLIKSPWIKMYTIPPKYVHKTTYYNVVPAYMSVLSYAFNHDSENLWFCTLTESCVPIISPAKFRELFLGNYEVSIFKWKPAYWNINIHRRANLRLLAKEYWLANDPWFTLSRAHVQKCVLFMVAKNGIYRQINEGGLANESMFAIMLQTFKELANEKTLINESSTITDWTRMSSPTSPHIFKEATEENINIIKKLLKDNKYCIFLRKVVKEFPDAALAELMEHDSQHTYPRLYNQAKKKRRFWNQGRHLQFFSNIKAKIRNFSKLIKNTSYECDADGLYGGCIVPIEQGYYMCIISSLIVFSSIYIFRLGKIRVSAMSMVVFFTSINYWRNPCYGFRRNLDISLLAIALSHQLCYALMVTNGYIYYYFAFMYCLCYAMSWYLYKQQKLWPSIMLHSCVHLFVNTGNIYLALLE